MADYDRCIRFWDEVYGAEEPAVPRSPDTGIPALTAAFNWLCDGAQSILDFGCGNGTALCWCALRGVETLTGIDLSPAAVRLARACAGLMPSGRFDYRCGGVDLLDALPDGSFDGVILMNILDNLYPEDGEKLLDACERLLTPGGKMLITMNPHLSPERIEAWNIRVMDGNLLDDGLPLYNLPDTDWRRIIGKRLSAPPPEPLNWPGQDLPGRLFRAQKTPSTHSTSPSTGGNP